MTTIKHPTPIEKEIADVAERAVKDFRNGTGAYFNGPWTGFYLRVIAMLQTEKARIELLEVRIREEERIEIG